MSHKKAANSDSGKEFTKVLKRLRSKSKSAPSLPEITHEVEIVRSKSKKKFDKATKEKYLSAIEKFREMLKGKGNPIKELIKEKKRELKMEDKQYKSLKL